MYNLLDTIKALNEETYPWHTLQATGLVLAFLVFIPLLITLFRELNKKVTGKARQLNGTIFKASATIALIGLLAVPVGNFLAFSSALQETENQAPALQSWIKREYKLEVSTKDAADILKDAGLLETSHYDDSIKAGAGVPSGIITAKSLTEAGAPEVFLKWEIVNGDKLIFTELDSQGRPLVSK